MIKITINGETKRFDSGMTVSDILEEFDSQDTKSAIAVKVDGKRLGLDNVIDHDCEIELLTFRDLTEKKSVDELLSDDSVEPSEYEFAPSQEEIVEYTMHALKKMLRRGGDDMFSLSETEEDDGDPFDNIAQLIDSLDDISGEDEPAQWQEQQDTVASDAPDDTENSASEVDDLFDENDPVFDGEFVSVRPDDAVEELTEWQDNTIDESGEIPDSEEASAPSYDITQIQDLQSKADEMQMHLGVPKIDDLVAELLIDMESKESDSLSPALAEDYSVDDGDMDAFLASQILPENVGSDSSADETAWLQESPEPQAVPEAGDYASYDVDEDSIEDFVDYGRSNAAEPIPYSRKEADDRRRRKYGVPLFAKAAALVVLLLGVGWLVSRIAIQAAGSPGVIRRDDGKIPVSVSDVSKTDEVSSMPSEKEPEYDKKQLAPGKSNALVKAVQKRLCALGYLDKDDADGSYNKAMEKAIDAFRKANGVKATGNIDEETFEKLFDGKAKTTASTVTTTTVSTTSTTLTTKATTTTTKTTKATATTTKATTTTTRRTTKATAATTTTTRKTTRRTTKKTTQKTTSEDVSSETEASQSDPTTADTTPNTTASTTASTTKSTAASTAKSTITTASTTKSTTQATSASHPDVPFEYDPSEVMG